MSSFDPSSVIRAARGVALGVLQASGVSKLIADSEWRRRRLLILCYHGVSLHDEHEWDPTLFVTPQFLRRRFELIREAGCIVLQLGDAIQKMRAGTLPKRSVVLTFDDGLYDFTAAAVPLLDEFGYPSTVYVSTYHCIHQRPLLFLSLRYLLWRARARDIGPGVFAARPNGVRLRDPGIRQAFAIDLLAEGRTLSNDRPAQLAWLAAVATSLGEDWPAFLRSRVMHLMTTDEIAAVAGKGVDIQLHTHRHRTPRDETAFRAEIEDNRQILESLTKRPASHFCYPSGDYDVAFLPLLRDMKIESATTGVVRLANADDEPLLLPRFIDTMAQSDLMFKSRLTGTAFFMTRSRGRDAA